MNIYITQKNEIENMHAKRLTSLFTHVFTKQVYIPFWKKMFHLIPNVYKLDVYFIFQNEYEKHGLKVINADKSHMAITYRINQERGKMIFDLDMLYRMYGRLQHDYFIINTYVTVMSHEIVHWQIINDNSIDSSMKWKYHRVLDKYQQGELEFRDVYDEIKYMNVKCMIYNYEKFKKMVEEINL
ncbi:MAG: hypothetical protein QXK74_07430 [Candidatus Nitrosocaldaceae archaeon]